MEGDDGAHEGFSQSSNAADKKACRWDLTAVEHVTDKGRRQNM